MATRPSTQKHEVYHAASGCVVLTGVSKTEAKAIARRMGKGFEVRPVRRAAITCAVPA
jgi:hypothetical protein